MSRVGQADSWGLGRRLMAWSAVFLCNLLPSFFSDNHEGEGFLAGVVLVWCVSIGLQALPYRNFRKAMVLGGCLLFAVQVCVWLILEANSTHAIGVPAYSFRRNEFAEFIETIGQGQLMLFVAILMGYCSIYPRKSKVDDTQDDA